MKENKKEKNFHFKGERTRSTLIILVGLIVYLLSLHLNIKIAYTVITAAISAMATFELERAMGVKNKILHAIACTVSVLFVFGRAYSAVTVKILNEPSVAFIAVLLAFYVIFLLCFAVVCNKTVKYTDAAAAFFASLAIPYSLSTFIALNEAILDDRSTHLEGLFLIWLAFSCSWVTDSFAFLVGRKIGKHKMAPVISPKKSVEGAVFGILLTAAANVLILFGYSLVASKMGYDHFLSYSNMKYLQIIPVSILLSIVSIFGDLAASVLKRNVGIKDFSNILPGHGGIMDRFDSCLFVLPVLWGICLLWTK